MMENLCEPYLRLALEQQFFPITSPLRESQVLKNISQLPASPRCLRQFPRIRAREKNVTLDGRRIIFLCSLHFPADYVKADLQFKEANTTEALAVSLPFEQLLTRKCFFQILAQYMSWFAKKRKLHCWKFGLPTTPWEGRLSSFARKKERTPTTGWVTAGDTESTGSDKLLVIIALFHFGGHRSPKHTHTHTSSHATVSTFVSLTTSGGWKWEMNHRNYAEGRRR